MPYTTWRQCEHPLTRQQIATVAPDPCRPLATEVMSGRKESAAGIMERTVDRADAVKVRAVLVCFHQPGTNGAA